jgi:hypothetical protein
VSKRINGWLGDLMRETGKSRRDLLVLADQRDPFYVGTQPMQRKLAEWFAAMFNEQYLGKTGIHIRRCHYRLDAIRFPKITGMPYTNPGPDWGMLCEASRVARILRLVPADAFEDHRNPEPYSLNWRIAEVREPTVFGTTTAAYDWELPAISSFDWTLKPPWVGGYSPDDYLDRAYLLQVWIEKSTMDDILDPLCKELRVRLVPATGFQSISNIVKFVKRVREIRKPTRIFYVSDHDKAGQHMPIAVARQIEFWRQHYAPDSDIKLLPLALTKEQIERYHLPVSEKNTVELDALEAIVPGELEEIVRAAVAPYMDENFDAQLAAASRRGQDIVRREWSRLMAPHKRTLVELNRRIEEIRRRNQTRLARELRPFKKPLAQLKADIAQAASKFLPDLPERPTEELDVNEESWLFDSARSYVEQLAFYKKQIATDSTTRRNGNRGKPMAPNVIWEGDRRDNSPKQGTPRPSTKRPGEKIKG